MPDALTVVLVDDAPDVRSLLRMRLKVAGGFDVLGEAGNGIDAVNIVEHHQPDLVLLDVSMPDMDGLDALEQIRKLAPNTQVVMFSGFEEHGLADRARALGAADFVEKSRPVEELIARLRAAAGQPSSPGPVTAPRSEPVLDEHLERFRAAFDQAAIGMATLTLTGRIVRANAALERVAGSASGSLVGTSYVALARLGVTSDLAAAIEGVARGEQDVASMEHELGTRAVVSTVAVVRDSQHTPLYLFLQVQDVTERRAAEEELRRSEERFRLLVEGVQDYAIFMLDAGGHIASWNLGAQRAKGYTADEVLGKHFSIFYLPDAIERGHPQYELEVAAAEGRYEEEGWRKRKDGTTFWANVVITAIRNAEGRLVGYAKVTRDVTERKILLDALETAAEERIQLLAVTAHELRNPVALVNGFAATLRDHWDQFGEDERQDMLSAVVRSGDRLSRLVEDLFTAARLESGGLEMRCASINVGAVVEEAVRDTDAAVEIDVAELSAYADRGRVQQMVHNYLTNARRHGAAPIAVTVSEHEGDVLVSVRDSGSGVPAGVRDELFSKFMRGGSHDGTGLGLFIVRELARAQGGDAWYEDAPEGGACFSFRLPANAPDAVP